MSKSHRDIETLAVHAGEEVVRETGSVATPIYQSATFAYSGESSYHDLRYIRLNNTPNHIAVQEKIASLCGGERCVVTGSGMAAIATVLQTFLKTGDHFLVQDCLYGGTVSLLDDFAELGILSTSIDAGDPVSWEGEVKQNTRLIYVESMTNPLLRVGDLGAVVAFARARGLVSVIDNTFLSPVNFCPLNLGFDIELHSATKYLNGHSDIVAGCAVGSAERVEAINHKLNHLGGCLDPHACFLLHRGLKTLPLRVRHQNESAEGLARFLDGHPSIDRVNHLGLPGHPDHARSTSLFGGYGGMLSICVKGDVAEADRFISRLKLPISAPSLGGVESLITRPALTSHSGVPKRQREAMGIDDRLVRVSVGIESMDDLCADFDQALKA